MTKQFGWAGVNTLVDAIIRRLDSSAWQTLSAGDGSRGERLYQWALATFEQPKNPSYNALYLLEDS